MAVNDQTSALEKIWPHKSALGFSKRILGDAGAPDRLTGLYRGETRINNYGNQPGNLEAKALVLPGFFIVLAGLFLLGPLRRDFYFNFALHVHGAGHITRL